MWLLITVLETLPEISIVTRNFQKSITECKSIIRKPHDEYTDNVIIINAIIKIPTLNLKFQAIV